MIQEKPRASKESELSTPEEKLPIFGEEQKLPKGLV